MYFIYFWGFLPFSIIGLQTRHFKTRWKLNYILSLLFSLTLCMLHFLLCKEERPMIKPEGVNLPETLIERPKSGQENFSNCQPQRFTQLTVGNCPLRLPLMKLFKRRVEGLVLVFQHCPRNSTARARRSLAFK